MTQINKTLTQHLRPEESEDELDDEINDKLSQLWNGMKQKRNLMIRNLTPGHSRRSERTLSSINPNHNSQNIPTHNTTSSFHKNTISKIKQKLSTNNLSKTNNQQTEQLKQIIHQLTTDNQSLMDLLKVKQQEYGLNQCTEIQQIRQEGDKEYFHRGYNQEQRECDVIVDGKTANFNQQNMKKNCSKNAKRNNKSYDDVNHVMKKDEKTLKFKPKPKSKHSTSITSKHTLTNNQNSNPNISQHHDSYHSTKPHEIPLSQSHSHSNSHSHSQSQSISQNRLIQLLKSTSQYRQFAYYYDSHELSYLKRLQQQHKKNCTVNLSNVQKKFWAPSEVIERLSFVNAKNKWGLSPSQLQEVIGEVKQYYQSNEQQKMKQLKQHYTKKIQKLKRQKENTIPYDLVRLSNARERDHSKKRNNKPIRQ